jgi:predicted transcriptional regulator
MSSFSKEIIRIITPWIESQKVLAEKIGMSPAAVCQILSGKKALPLSRFLQIVHASNPPVTDIAKAFSLYLDECKIPRERMSLVIHSYGFSAIPETPREKIHRLVNQLSEEQLQTVESMLGLLVNARGSSYAEEKHTTPPQRMFEPSKESAPH